MANDIRISELNEITVNSNINEIVINNRESVADAGVTKKIQVANLLTDSIINTNNLANSSVTTDKIADKSISADKIADKTITNSQIANYTIGNNELATNSVDNRVLDNDESFVVDGLTATRSILSPRIEASDRLTVTSGLVDLNQIAYTFPSTQTPRNFLRTDGAGNLTWEAAVPGDSTALVFDNISPVGTVIPYAGNASSVPNDKWLNLFADRRFLGAAYPELRDLLDTTWGPRTDAGGAESPTGPYYALPDLKVAALSAGEVSDIIKGTAFEPAQVGVYNSAHNLGTVPDVFGATAICTTAEYGWQVGDEIIINTQVDGSHTSNNGAPTTVYADDTNVYFRTTSKASGYWVGEIATADGSGTNGEARLTVGNWDVVLWWYDNTIDSAMSYIIKAKPDDIQQYDVVTGPGLSAIDALGVQSPTITLSSSEIGLKVSEDFTFDGSNRLKINDTWKNVNIDLGRPIQYVNNHINTTHRYNKTADVDLHVTQLDTSVTLKDANSKVYITAMITAESYTHNGVWKLFRKVGGTETEIGSNTGTTGNNRRGIATGMYDGDDSSTPNNVYIQYMDTPGSASVEYLFKWNSDGTGNNYFTLNGSQLVTTDEDYEQASSNVNLVEIGG